MGIKVSRGKTNDRYYLFKLFGFGLFLHRIHGIEEDYHTHPWDGVSLILWGQYGEWYLDKSFRIRRWFNYIKATRHHRVATAAQDCWTLFFHFRKYNRWEVVDRYGKLIATEPWNGAGGFKDYGKGASPSSDVENQEQPAGENVS